MAQTAVEWLIQQLKSRFDIDIERLSVTDQAKAMEKQQIKFSYNDGAEDMIADKYKAMEDYYNQTYNK
jgi:hypothetical protein